VTDRRSVDDVASWLADRTFRLTWEIPPG